MTIHGPHSGKQTRSRVTIPQHVNPLVAFIFAELRRQNVSYDELSWRSGVLRSTVKAWRKTNTPHATSLEAALGALGWQLTVAPAADRTLPDGLRTDLQAVAEKHGLSSIPALEFLARFGGYSHPGCPLAERRRLNQLQQGIAQ